MNQELADIKELVRYVQKIETLIENKEQEIKELTQRLELFNNDLIPEYILGMGLSEVKLDTGEAISVKTKYFGNISAERAEAAHKWLTENGNAALIKTEISATFGAGQEEQVDLLVLKNFLKENEMEVNEKKAVHPQTLKSFIKNSMENGVKFPYELFGVYVAKELVVNKPKTK
jgi:predicted transcriptional regulator